VATIKVLELPPKLSLSKQVNFESLYGMCTFGLSLAKANALITIPKVVSDLLIFPAYFSRSPVAWVAFCLSDPAKSTKWSLGVLRHLCPSVSNLIDKDIVKME